MAGADRRVHKRLTNKPSGPELPRHPPCFHLSSFPHDKHARGSMGRRRPPGQHPASLPPCTELPAVANLRAFPSWPTPLTHTLPNPKPPGYMDVAAAGPGGPRAARASRHGQPDSGGGRGQLPATVRGAAGERQGGGGRMGAGPGHVRGPRGGVGCTSGVGLGISGRPPWVLVTQICRMAQRPAPPMHTTWRGVASSSCAVYMPQALVPYV